MRELEGSSEALAADFKSGKGDMDVEAFLRAYRKQRVALHLRSAKLEHIRNVQLR